MSPIRRIYKTAHARLTVAILARMATNDFRDAVLDEITRRELFRAEAPS